MGERRVPRHVAYPRRCAHLWCDAPHRASRRALPRDPQGAVKWVKMIGKRAGRRFPRKSARRGDRDSLANRPHVRPWRLLRQSARGESVPRIRPDARESAHAPALPAPASRPSVVSWRRSSARATSVSSAWGPTQFQTHLRPVPTRAISLPPRPRRWGGRSASGWKAPRNPPFSADCRRWTTWRRPRPFLFPTRRDR